MRMYGRQHELNWEYLEKNMFYGHYLKDEGFPEGCRHWHPTEIVLKHGLTNQCFIHEDVCLAWEIHGNVVTTIQVLPLLVAWANTSLMQKHDIQVLTQKYLDMCWNAHETGFQQIKGGYFMSLINEPISQAQLDAYESLALMIHTDASQDMIWHPEVDEHTSNPPGICEATMITLPTPVDTQPGGPQDTVPFGIILKARILFEGSEQYFWFSADLPFAHLPVMWDDHFRPVPLDLSEMGKPTVDLVMDLDYNGLNSDEPTRAVCLLNEDNLTLLQIPSDMPVIQHPALASLAAPCDQFGFLPSNKCASDNMLIMPQRVAEQVTPVMPVMVAAAFSQCISTWVWNPKNDHLTLGVRGDPIPRQTIADFWAGILHTNLLKFLGRRVEIHCSAYQLLVIFVPTRNEGVCPPNQLRTMLLAIAAQVLLDDAHKGDEHAKPVIIRWKHSDLWTGRWSPQVSVEVVQHLLTIAMSPMKQAGVPQLKHQGSILCVSTLEQIFASDSLGPHEFDLFFPAENVLRFTGGGWTWKTTTQSVSTKCTCFHASSTRI